MKMQIERLFETVYYLMQKGNVTAGRLAERLGVSARTVASFPLGAAPL